MFISRKKYEELCKRVDELESEVRKLKRITTVDSWDLGNHITLRELCRNLPAWVDARFAKNLKNVTIQPKI